MKNLHLSQQAELASKILKDGLPWQTQFPDSIEWDEVHEKSDPITALSRGATIRIKPTSILIPLEASDIPPGSVISVHPNLAWFLLVWVGTSQVNYMSTGKMATLTVGELLSENWLINRSIPLLGKWNPTAWEPCSKPSQNPG